MKKYLFLFVIFIYSSLFSAEIVNIGYYNNPPKIYHDSLNNKPAGFWADITNEIAKQEDILINWVYGDWPTNYEKLVDGKIDVLIDIADLEERKASIEFSNELVMVSWSLVYLNKSKNFTDLYDFHKKRIGVLKESMNYKFEGGIESLLSKFDIECDFVEFNSYPEVLESVNNGYVDYGISSKTFGNSYCLTSDVKAAPFWFQPLNLKYGFNKGARSTPYLISIFDKQLKRMKNDRSSVYYKSLAKYFSIEEGSNRKILFVSGIILLLLVGIITYLLHRSIAIRVDRKTKHLNLQVEEISKDKQELIVAKSKLEEVGKFKDNFFRSVTHELRTPLHAILGFSELLKNSDLSRSDREEFLRIIIQSSKKLLKIVNNIIDASQVKADSYLITNQEVDVNKYLNRQFLRINLSDTRISKKSKIDLPDRLILLSDVKKLTKILDHLIENAVKFTQKGSVTLGAKIVSNKLQIFVKDTGIGIDKEDYDYLFVSFSQVDSDYSRKYDGTGLGLTIAKSLSEALGGRLWLESEFGVGSTFYIEIPLNKENTI